MTLYFTKSFKITMKNAIIILYTNVDSILNTPEKLLYTVIRFVLFVMINIRGNNR